MTVVAYGTHEVSIKVVVWFEPGSLRVLVLVLVLVLVRTFVMGISLVMGSGK